MGRGRGHGRGGDTRDSHQVRKTAWGRHVLRERCFGGAAHKRLSVHFERGLARGYRFRLLPDGHKKKGLG